MKIQRQVLIAVLTTGAAALLALTLAAFFGTHGHRLELLSNLRIPLMLASVVLTVGILALRALWAVALPVLSLVINVALIVPYYLPDIKPPVGSAKLSIATINIYGFRNKQYERVIGFIKEKHPDVVCFDEYTRDWMQHARAALPEYDYTFVEGVSGGAAVLSRVPIERVPPLGGNGERRYGVRGIVHLGGREVLLMAVHPPNPIKRKNEKARNQEFERLATEARDSKLPVIIIGDMNATAWSPYFQRLVDESGLHDSEKGFGIQPTWCELMLLPMVPIDHCLTSKDLVVTRREVGPDVGSDHLPVCVDIQPVK